MGRIYAIGDIHGEADKLFSIIYLRTQAVGAATLLLWQLSK